MKRKPIIIESESGYERVVWTGETFAFGVRIDGKYWYQGLLLSCRGASAQRIRPMVARLLAKCRAAGIRPDRRLIY